MARYIDLDKAIERLNASPAFPNMGTDGDFLLGVVEDLLKKQPTAEVVPKSEVERLQEALSKAEADVKNYMKVAEYQQNLSVKRYHEIKRLNEDVERLQEEIETFKDTNEHLAVLLEEAKQAYSNYEETSGLKQAKKEVAREIFEEIEKVTPKDFTKKSQDFEFGYRIAIQEIIAELKKKYTEEKK